MKRPFFRITLAVFISFGVSCDFTRPDNAPPLAVLTVSPTEGTTDSLYFADASKSVDDEDETSSLLFRWDWQGDGVWETGWTETNKLFIAFPVPGEYPITVTVRDQGALSDTTSVSVKVNPPNGAPSAEFTVTPASGDRETVFVLDASGSSDAEDGLAGLQVRWDFESDGTWDTDWSAEKTVSHTYVTAGSYTITLEVTDTSGLTDTATKVVTVSEAPVPNTAPTAAFTVTPGSGDTETVFVLDASGSSDAEDGLAGLQVRWDFESDGTWDTDWSAEKTVSHTYVTAGSYTITLEVTDTGGLTDTATKVVTVSEVPPPPDPAGSLLWKFATGGAIKSSPAIGPDGTIYFSSMDGYLYAVDPEGVLKWQFEMPSNTETSPVIGADGNIYMSVRNSGLLALNPSGSGLWQYEAKSIIDAMPAISYDGTIYFVTNNGFLYAINSNGELEWNVKLASAAKISPSLRSDGEIIIISGNGTLTIVDTAGSIQSETSIGGAVHISPAIGDGNRVYAISNPGDLNAIDSNGVTLWTYSADRVIVSSPSIGEDGTVYVESDGGVLLAISENGVLNWSYPFQLSAAVNSTPAIGSDGTIHVGSPEGAIYALQSDGALYWTFMTGGSINSSPTLGSGGTLYVGSDDGYLYAITSSSSGLANSAWPKFRGDTRNSGKK